MDAQRRYGCHVDLEEDQQPDDCVIEYGAHGDCLHARFANGRLRRSPRTCKYWRPVEESAQ